MSFETITSGPSNATGQNPAAAPNGLSFDQQNNLLASVGKSGVEQLLKTTILTLQEQTALTTITTAQNMISLALNAWVLNRANRNLRIRGRGIYTSPGTTTPTITLAVNLDGTTSLVSITTAAISSTASSNMPFEFDFTLSVAATGASAASIEAHGRATVNITANTPAAAAAAYLDTNTAVVGSLNLQTTHTLNVTIAASSTVTSAQLLNATIEASGN